MKFRLLGPMQIEVGGEAAALPSSAERALLVQLLLSPGRTIPATMLIDHLWGEDSLPVDPINALQIRVSKLRRGLKAIGLGEVVIRDAAGYRADVSPADVDAVEFTSRVRQARASAAAAGSDYRPEHLAAYDSALALWRGEPLVDFNAEHWAVVEAARLTEIRLGALTERAKIALALGRHLEVVEELEPLVAEDPTRESLTGMLMTALWRSGRQVEALAAFSRTRTMLGDELGLEPSAALRSLHERILRQDESLGGPVDLVPPAPLPARWDRADHRLSAPPINLPTEARPLIGRDAQLDSICSLATGVRILTLVGPGGAGKTSLAVAAVLRLASGYVDGAAAVWLASVEDPDQVPLAVADAIGVPLDGAAADTDIRQRLVNFLAARRVLLLLDNCEHVVDSVATLAHEIVGRSSGVTIIATSREALAVPDEVQVPVGPLETAPQGTAASRILAFPASQLFVERARAVRPGTVFSPEDLLAIGRISRSLDGIPLAIELAAARVTLMSTIEIAEGLSDRFALLTSGPRTVASRQRTLRATVDWSYALLGDRERFVFNRLAVFQGRWTLAAAEAVVGTQHLAPGEILDAVGRLVEQSMVVTERGPTTRYRLLETLRDYAMARLIDEGAEHETARRHAEYFRHLTAEAERELRGSRQQEIFAVLHDEQRNIRAAITWFSDSGDLDAASEMAGSLGLFWHLGRHLEGREVLRRLLARSTGAPSARARALQALSLVERPRACLVHPSPRCADAARESLEIFEEIGDASRAALSRLLLAVEGVSGANPAEFGELLRSCEAQFTLDDDPWGLAVIGFVRMEAALKSGEEAAATRIGQSTAAAFRNLADRWGLSAVLYHLGWGLGQFGRYRESARVLEEAIDVASSAGLYNTVQWAWGDLGLAHLHLGDVEAARDAFDRARRTADQVGDGAGNVLADYGFGVLGQIKGDWGEARTRFSAALDGFRRLGTPVSEGMALVGLARCSEVQGDTASARELFQQVHELAATTGDPALAAAAMEGLGRAALATGDRERAQQLILEAAAFRRSRNRPAAPFDRVSMEPASD